MTLTDAFRAVQRRALFILVVILAVEAAGYSRQRSFVISQSKPIFVSTGKLLLRSASSSIRAFGAGIQVNPGETQSSRLWFIDFRYIREMLLDEKFLTRVLQQTKDRPPGITVSQFQSQIIASPITLNSEQMGSFYSTVDSGDNEDAVQNLDEETEDELADPNDPNSNFHRNRMQLITISVRGDNPRSAAALATALVNAFLAEARNRAARELTEERIAVEKQYDKALLNVQRLERALKARVGVSSPTQRRSLEAEVQNKISRLESDRLSERFKALELEHQLESATQDLTTKAPQQGAVKGQIVQALESARMQYTSDQAVYRPDSPFLLEEKKQLDGLASLQATVSREGLHSQILDLQNRLGTVRKKVVALEKQLTALRAALTSTPERREVLRIEQARDYWDANALSMVPALYRSRIREQQAEERGALMLIDEPQLGTLLVPSVLLAPSLVTPLALFPLAFSAGLCLAVALDYLYRRNLPAARLAQSLKVPVWAVIPTFAKSVVALEKG